MADEGRDRIRELAEILRDGAEDEIRQGMEDYAAGKQPSPYAGIICPSCGKVPIEYPEYSRQISDPDARWACPGCKREAEFDDDAYEAIHFGGPDAA